MSGSVRAFTYVCMEKSSKPSCQRYLEITLKLFNKWAIHKKGPL